LERNKITVLQKFDEYCACANARLFMTDFCLIAVNRKLEKALVVLSKSWHVYPLLVNVETRKTSSLEIALSFVQGETRFERNFLVRRTSH